MGGVRDFGPGRGLDRRVDLAAYGDRSQIVDVDVRRRDQVDADARELAAGRAGISGVGFVGSRGQVDGRPPHWPAEDDQCGDPKLHWTPSGELAATPRCVLIARSLAPLRRPSLPALGITRTDREELAVAYEETWNSRRPGRGGPGDRWPSDPNHDLGCRNNDATADREFTVPGFGVLTEPEPHLRSDPINRDVSFRAMWDWACSVTTSNAWKASPLQGSCLRIQRRRRPVCTDALLCRRRLSSYDLCCARRAVGRRGPNLLCAWSG